MNAKLAALVVALLLGGCALGKKAQDVPAAKRPEGFVGKVVVGTTTLHGELIALTDSSLLLLADRKLTEVLRSKLRRCEFPPFVHLCSDRDLRLISRFPYGLSSDALRQLLAQHQQDSIERVN